MLKLLYKTYYFWKRFLNQITVMDRKIKLLITVSTLVLLILSLVQYYLVTTAYEYKVSQFRNEVKEKLAKISNDYSDIDSTIFIKKDTYYKQLALDYLNQKKERSEIKEALLKNNFKEELTRKLQEEFEYEIPDLYIRFAVVLNKFIVYNQEKKRDTIHLEPSSIANKMFGNLNTLENAFLVRNYVGTNNDVSINNEFQLLTEDTLYVSVQDWEIIVWKRMKFILLFAIASIVILITLFLVALKALIQQKKISDIKTDFINNITHEFKTPLTTLTVSTKLLERNDVKENEALFKQLLETITRQNHQLQKLVDQAMNNSLGHEELAMQKEKVNIHAFLQNIISDFKISNPTITTNFQSASENISISIDKFHVTTAIVNILENAVKYGSNHINIVSILQNNEININIQDNGIGIAKNQQNLLFDKFYRVEKGNIHNSKGLGLGLYYVEQIVKAHQGQIKIASDIGKGAMFTIALPY